MTARKMTTIRDHLSAPYSEPICLADDGPDAIVHLIGEDCGKVHGLRITDRRCSVCDLEWGAGAVSQHERCGWLYEDGSRRYADCVVYLSDGSRLAYAS